MDVEESQNRGMVADMLGILSKALSFVAIVALGYVMKRMGVFQTKDFYVLSKIIIRVTFPCAIIANFSAGNLDMSMLVLCGMGVCCCLVMVGIGYLVNIKKSGEEKAFYMLNLASYNIGNFTMPYVQTFLGPAGFAAAGLFDIGNALMNTGGNYSLACAAKGGGGSVGKMLAKALLLSPPFVFYVIMTVVSLLNLQVPQLILDFAGTGAGCNTFLALFMVGIGLEIRIDREKLRTIGRILVLRYSACIVMAVLFYTFLPMALEIRRTLALLMLSPLGTVTPAYTGKLGGNVELSSTIVSVEILISIVLIIGALMLIM